mgnify:CR=1 FL=1
MLPASELRSPAASVAREGNVQSDAGSVGYVQPQLVNENAVGPKVNPFKELYWKQFGGRPDQETQPKTDSAKE